MADLQRAGDSAWDTADVGHQAGAERWQRHSGNDRARTVRVLVPDGWLAPANDRPPDRPDAPAMSGEFARLLTEANARADAANRRADAVLAVAEEAGQRARDLSARLDRAEVAAWEAQKALTEARKADEARKARGRLRRAWDGWRGR
jgi:hypothetical protein